MPKTLTGAELELDDAPARDCELFLVDGNNLAYRAFFALPEELATTDGQPTNALLGFTNMLFKLLADYRPKGVAVAWDSRPVHRAAVAEAADVVYKEGRRPMPDLLREQFPHFRPIVEAFGYRNLEFEGWEADDVIATLATRADAAGIRTCVVSTDRDAFQLCSRERLPDDDAARRRRRATSTRRSASRPATASGPTRCRTSSASRATPPTTSRASPGIGDKTAGQLIAQYGSLEAVIEHAAELSPARAQNITEHADQARVSKQLATMRRDLDIECDPGAARARPARPLAAQGDLPPLRVPQPAGPGRRARRGGAGGAARGRPASRFRGAKESSIFRGVVGYAADGDRAAVATRTTRSSSVRSAARSSCARRELVVHDAKSLRVDAADDTLLAAYLIEPGPRLVRARRPRRPSTASSSSRRRPPRRRPRRSSARAELPRRLIGPLLERLEERGAHRALPRRRAAAHRRARRDGGGRA